MSEFLRAPMTVGAVAASGRRLTRAAIAPVPAGADVVVVELGPGTGVMTSSIEQRLVGRARQLAIEVDTRLASSLSTHHPAVEVVQADAADLGAVLTDRGITHADVIVSGLPWAASRPQQQERLLDAVVTGLSTDGVFTTFAYVHSRWTPAARRFRRELLARFDEVLIGRTVWPGRRDVVALLALGRDRVGEVDDVEVSGPPQRVIRTGGLRRHAPSPVVRRPLGEPQRQR